MASLARASNTPVALPVPLAMLWLQPMLRVAGAVPVPRVSVESLSKVRLPLAILVAAPKAAPVSRPIDRSLAMKAVKVGLVTEKSRWAEAAPAPASL